MNNIIKIAKWELFRYIRSKAFIITLIIPFIVILIAGVPQYLAINSEQPVMNIGIIDKGNNLFSEIEKQVSNDSEAKGKDQFILQHYTGVENNENIFIKELIKSNIADIVVVLETQLIDSGNAKFYHRNNIGIEQVSKVEQMIFNVVKNQRIENLQLNRDDLEYVRKNLNTQLYEISEQGEMEEMDMFVKYVIPGIFMFVLLLGILTSSQLLVTSVIEERSNRIIEILLSSVNTKELMAGKILGIGLLGIIQISFYLIIIIILGIFGSSYLPIELNISQLFSFKILWYLLFFILGYFMYSTIYVSLGSLFNNERDAQQTIGFFSLFAIIPIYFISFIITNPESIITKILTLIPPITPFFMIIHVGMLSAPWYYSLGMAFYLILWIIGITFIASRVFKTAILMYGKRPTFPELFRWIRSSK
ncbi:MAG: ABC transporter permease [Candidatus Marinimicrobia bacterium]|jgi:ABC-2 type transport system permease protein|nr:ABC transporter permease [Candidatus Neomarinimicrobiota bacterium]